MKHPPPNPATDELQQSVEAALLRMAFERLPMSVLLTIAVCAVFVTLFWSFFPSSQKVVWVASMLAVSVLRLGLWRAHARSTAPAPRIRFWKRLFFAGAVAGGASWGYGPVMLMPPSGHTESMLLVLAVLAVSAVSMSALGALPTSMRGFQFAAIMPTIFALAATGGAVERMAAAVMFAGMLSLMIVGRASSAATRSLIEAELRLSGAVRATDAARARAEAASHAKTRFLANMSHELRTPLNTVIGAAQLLKTGERDPERQEQLVNAIQRSGTNLLGLIENILDLSRIEAGELKLAAQDFHLFDCVDAALATAGLAARAKNLRLACIANPALPAWRHADAARLRQVLINLLGNAVKFTDKGEIVVRVGNGATPDQVRITISDTGVGIRPDALAHVFEPFRQGDDSAGRRFGGTGLGLAIVRQLVQVMGGQISVQSMLGQGSTFELVLPMPLAPDPQSSPEMEHRQVAFFEPHEASAEALQALLTRMGCLAQRCTDVAGLRAWCAEHAQSMERAWLLVCTEAEQTQALLEQALDVLEPERVIGMSADESFNADMARERFKLPRNVVKPVSRSALASRFVRTLVGGVAPVTAPMALLPLSGDPGQPATHILVVEDDALNQAIVSRMLRHAGYHVSVVSDGHSALATLREQQFDLVLMDWQMPDMDGLEVTRRMRAGEAGAAAQSVPVVALTANAFAEDRDACLAAGMNDFLTKPVLAASLTATIERWTDRVSSGHLAKAGPTPPKTP